MNEQEILNAGMSGAQQYIDGDCTWDEFTSGMAYLTLRAQGVELPTIAQVEQRVAEMNTASAFIGSIPKPED